MGLVSSKCPECGASIKINDKATGKLTCPFCGSSYQAEDALKTKRSTIQNKTTNDVGSKSKKYETLVVGVPGSEK